MSGRKVFVVLKTLGTVSISTPYKLAVDNKLPGQKIGKRWRFHKDAIDAWVKRGPRTHQTGGDE